jgi:hypothetical protein
MGPAGKPDTDAKIAAPLFTDLKQHRARSGSSRVRMEARQIGGGGSNLKYLELNGFEKMELLKASGNRFRSCGLAAANPAPNKKRLAQRSRRPHRPHLTCHRKSPKCFWGAFSTPGLNAGEGWWKRGAVCFFGEFLFLRKTTKNAVSPPRRA